ncbi:MAG TPA: hypothetical protein VKY92_16345 [Verrucomicrobiae bacterium]|nr:hypothetical protein [Verrucomicrobiae bacterium]
MRPHKYSFGLAFGVALCLAMPLNTLLAVPPTVVYPTGVWPDDVNNVQAAVSAGGIVLLKAVNSSGTPTAFNFGTPELLPGRKVLIEANVTIRGESVGAARTTIQGGLSPFSGFTAVSRRITGIDFKGPGISAIGILASKDSLDVSGNRISGLVPVRNGVGFTETEGVFVSGFDSHAVSGSVRVAGNEIDLSTSTAQFRFGIQLDSINADVDISENEISVGQSPIIGRVIDSEGIALLRCHARVHVSENIVRLGTNPVYLGIDGAGDADATFDISDNLVLNDSPSADGIVLQGGGFNSGIVGGRITGNVVINHGSQYGAISLYGLVSDVTVAGNSISGDGAYGLLVSFAYGTDKAVGNRLLGNELESFKAGVADVYLDANSQNTTVRGECGTVIDLGINNSVSCED